MQINVRTHHVDITQALKDYSQKKMHKLEKYFDNIQEILVELDIIDTADENKRQVAMATIWASHTILRAKVTSKDMYASIDMLFEKLEKQLIKHKDKMKNRKNGSFRSIHFPLKNSKGKFSSPVSQHKEDKYFNPKPMSAEEAADLLELESLPFLVFRNSVSERINVIYLSDSGDYNLIET